jgi:hypothetical protein
MVLAVALAGVEQPLDVARLVVPRLVVPRLVVLRLAALRLLLPGVGGLPFGVLRRDFLGGSSESRPMDIRIGQPI